ncbi:PREDICTED: DNA oxidative demethylase ALKBH2-like [Amphimedon queenslandica]|uniref:DNA oxidative demethylase ALKBH2 n=1 Tax=Amphimedon queenslandica TaxID=400682 RepID=A0A1X7VW58_AMPQE|nr:PREDICTED: DNA oxidative demethylase ALKBH2-like [Amphimedon queenslandica]|eukprot:XP_003382435.1 PREDICTED: DNA oxidative demethylase ALKBH2-like [Amphimedon queenslandica]
MDTFVLKRKRNDESDADVKDLEPARKRRDFTSSSGESFHLCTDVITRLERPEVGLNVLYYPSFMSLGDSKTVLKQLEETLAPYFDQSPNIVKIGGKTIPIPRQQTAFGDKGLKYSFSGISLNSNAWIPIISSLKSAVEWASGDKFNFVLVNRYKNGDDHIGEHRDDERELDPLGMIASLSFGAERDFVFRHSQSRGKNAKRKDISPVKINLLSGSLLLMRSPTNREWYHSLPVRKGVRDVRINLTFRRMVINDRSTQSILKHD